MSEAAATTERPIVATRSGVRGEVWQPADFEQRTQPLRTRGGCYDNPFSTWRMMDAWSLLRVMPRLMSLPTPTVPFEVVAPDWEAVRSSDSRLQVVWLGHATTYVRLDGWSILTDPVWAERASPVQFAGPKRYTRMPCAIRDLAGVDVVLISHNHYDHLDLQSVRDIEAQFSPLWIVPAGLAAWMRAEGVGAVAELSWWERCTVSAPATHPARAPLHVAATPVQHWSKRSLTDACRSLWCSYAVMAPDGGPRYFFTGDTGYCEAFREIGEVFGPFDCAAVPIGAYEPRWFMQPQHVNPEEAVKIHMDLRARMSFGIHWGTFPLTTEPPTEPPVLLERALEEHGLPRTAFLALRHGERVVPQLETSAPTVAAAGATAGAAAEQHDRVDLGAETIAISAAVEAAAPSTVPSDAAHDTSLLAQVPTADQVEAVVAT